LGLEAYRYRWQTRGIILDVSEKLIDIKEALPPPGWTVG
jgi:hypothetical protein